jgi:hypothetical protein
MSHSGQGQAVRSSAYNLAPNKGWMSVASITIHYPRGVVIDQQMSRIQLDPHSFHSNRTYTILLRAERNESAICGSRMFIRERWRRFTKVSMRRRDRAKTRISTMFAGQRSKRENEPEAAGRERVSPGGDCAIIAYGPVPRQATSEAP